MKLFLRMTVCALAVLVVSSVAALAWDRGDQASASQTTDGHAPDH